MDRTWNELRTETRTLESRMDAGLADYNRLGNAFTESGWIDKYNQSTSLLENLLQKLKNMQQEMSSHHSSTSQRYALQRHCEIILDYTQEFQRLKRNLLANRERDELLRSVVRNDVKEQMQQCTEPENYRQHLLLNEHESLVASHRMLDLQLQAASDIRLELGSQGGQLRDSHTHLLDGLTTRFPQLDRLIAAVSFRQRRDTLLLGSIFGLCTFLLLVYMFWH